MIDKFLFGFYSIKENFCHWQKLLNGDVFSKHGKLKNRQFWEDFNRLTFWHMINK
jgi:hypothetical protein